MKLHTITLTCDPCASWKGRETVDGVETVPVAGGQTLDLCPDHRDGMRRFIELVAEFGEGPETPDPGDGRKSKRKVKRESSRPQLVERRAAPERNGARAHATIVARTVEEVEGDHATECPMCGHVSPTSSALAMHLRQKHHTSPTDIYGRVCPLCGAESVTTGGLGVHGSVSHGIGGGGVAALFARARNEGDPLDVIASRARALVEAASA